MAIDLPPKLWTPAKPALVRLAEHWEARAHRDLAVVGVPRNLRRAVVAELKRVSACAPALEREAAHDLARFAGDPRLAMPLMGTFAAASARGLRKAGGAVAGGDAVTFDGTNDYISFGANPFSTTGGIANYSVVCWFKINGADATRFVFHWDSASQWLLMRESDNKVAWNLYTSASGSLWLASGTNNARDDEGWLCFMQGYTTTAGTKYAYLNDTQDGTTTATSTMWSNSGTSRLFSTTGGGNRFNGDVYYYWMAEEYLDFSVEANRRKFISAGGKAVWPGDTGAVPTGNQPRVFVGGPLATWHNNKGAGASTTLTGSLTLAGTTPA